MTAIKYKMISQNKRIKELEDAIRKHRDQKLEDAIRKHRDQKLDDKCWKDDLELYNKLPEGCQKLNTLPPTKQFLENCERYCKSQQIPSEYKKEYMVYVIVGFGKNGMVIEKATLDKERAELLKEDSKVKNNWIAGISELKLED